VIDDIAIVGFAQRKPTPWQDAITIRGRLHELMARQSVGAAARLARPRASLPNLREGVMITLTVNGRKHALDVEPETPPHIDDRPAPACRRHRPHAT
jgi:hypothetical protein